jgi:AP-1 complex subunit mu
MKCYLSGMPELRLGPNDKVMFESTERSKHRLYKVYSLIMYMYILQPPAEKLSKWKTSSSTNAFVWHGSRMIARSPPDGEFELMSYRISTPVKPLIWIEAAVKSHKGSRVEYMVKCKAQFKRRSTANNVEIFVPVPDDADTPKFRVSGRLGLVRCSV